MSTLIYSGTHGASPNMTYEIYYTATRNRNTITITFDITSVLNPYGALYNIGPVVFYGGSVSGSTQANTTIKAYYNDQWGPSSDGAPRYRSCSFTVDTYSSNMDLYFRIDVGNISSPHALTEQKVNVSIPAYNPPSAPTWTSISPNPCAITNKPVVSWGGASAGSSGQLLYDIEVRSTKSSGGWTDWLRIKNSCSGTSYTGTVLSGMNVNGQKPYVGVKYQYRIRSYGNLAGDSDVSAWKTTSELTVSFTAPTAPTVKWNPTTVKKNKTTTLSWSGASGGSGSITNYKVVINLTEKNKTTILSTNTSTQSGTSMIVDVLKTFSTAKNGNYLKATVYTNNSWGQQSSGSTPVYALVKGNQIWIKIGGSWKEGECYVKINGSWKEGLPYIKVNGSWKESV